MHRYSGTGYSSLFPNLRKIVSYPSAMSTIWHISFFLFFLPCFTLSRGHPSGPGAPETRLDCVFPVTSCPYTSGINFMSRFFQCVQLTFEHIDCLRFFYVCWQFVPCIQPLVDKNFYFLILVLECFLYILCLCPLVHDSFLGNTVLLSTLSMLLIIL